MPPLEAKRTLVKSPPELWAEISDAGALAGHLGAFGEIRITRLEPETTVAWEGDRARGTVKLEPAGWGTKVTLTDRIAAEPAAAGPAPEAAGSEAEPEAETAAPGREASAPGAAEAEAPRPRPRRRWWPFGRRRVDASPPAPEPPARAPVAASPAPETTPASLDARRAAE